MQPHAPLLLVPSLPHIGTNTASVWVIEVGKDSHLARNWALSTLLSHQDETPRECSAPWAEELGLCEGVGQDPSLPTHEP